MQCLLLDIMTEINGILTEWLSNNPEIIESSDFNMF